MNLIKTLNESKKVYDVPLTPELTKGFCLGISSGDAFICKVIKAYSQYMEKIDKRYLASHAFTVFDGSVFESNAAGNQERHISKYIKNGHEFWLFTMPVDTKNYELALAYAKGALGRVYDYPGFARFLFKWIPQLKYGDFCSEYASTIVQEYLKLPFIELKPEDISPARMLQYLMNAGSDQGWELVGHYKGGQKLLV